MKIGNQAGAHDPPGYGAQSSDHHHHKKDDRQDHIEGKGIEETQDKTEQPPGDTRIKGADGKGQGLVNGQIHPDDLRGDIAVPDGHERPADPGLEDVSRTDDHENSDDQYQIVLLEIGLQNPSDAQLADPQIERRHLDSHSAPEEIDSSDDMHDRQPEPQGSDRQIGAFESQRRQAEDKAEKRGDKCSREDGEDKGDLKLGHQKGCSVSADGKKSGMAERYLAGGSHENVQTHGQYDMDHDDIEEIDVIIGCIQGKSEKEKQQRYRPEKNHSTLEKPDILIIVALHVHRITYNAKSRIRRESGSS